MEVVKLKMVEELLNEAIKERDGYWRNFLINNRKPERHQVYRVPYQKIGRDIYYNREEVAKFIDWEKSRRLGTVKLTGRAAEAMRAYGIGEDGGGTTGRKLEVTGINAQFDEVKREPYIQLITSNPLMVYRIPLEQAKVIHAELGDIIVSCDRWAEKVANENQR